jgi:hypothetical protein
MIVWVSYYNARVIIILIILCPLDIKLWLLSLIYTNSQFMERSQRNTTKILVNLSIDYCRFKYKIHIKNIRPKIN